MKMYCITFRSVTPAQRGQRLLQGEGVHCAVQRTPRWMEERGCGYCLKIRTEDAKLALGILQANHLAFSKVYAEDNGNVSEIRL
jgi:hypothetical protein